MESANRKSAYDISFDNADELAILECAVCKCEVSEDEYCVCPECDNAMCIYCWGETSCPEHAVPYGDLYWQTVYNINNESFAEYCDREEKLKREGLWEEYQNRINAFTKTPARAGNRK